MNRRMVHGHKEQTILALGLAQQVSQMLFDDVEAEATGNADAADECELAQCTVC